jgi:phosphate transport system permease protein
MVTWEFWAHLTGNTLLLTGIALVTALPLALGTAIYLHLFAGHGARRRWLRLGLELLAAVPSVLVGLLGFWFLVVRLDLGWSLLSGGLTLAVMLLPGLAVTAEAALAAVPTSRRAASLALGADTAQTLWRVDLPGALPGILAGVVLALARGVGETAVVLLTVGTSWGPHLAPLPERLAEPGRSLAVQLYLLATEGGDPHVTWQCAGLLVLVGLLTMGAARAVGSWQNLPGNFIRP